MRLRNYLGGDLGGSGCWGGNCPSIYQSDSGTFVVQGRLIPQNELTGLEIPANEGVVEVPESLLRALAAKMAKS